MSELCEGADVLSVAVSIRDPSDGHQPCPVVDTRVEILDVSAAILFWHDAKLDAFLFFELSIENEGGDEVEFIDDDVVSWAKIETVGDDILGVACGVENGDLIGLRAEKLTEALTHVLSLFSHPCV